jgi:hypothetical protein
VSDRQDNTGGNSSAKLAGSSGNGTSSAPATPVKPKTPERPPPRMQESLHTERPIRLDGDL